MAEQPIKDRTAICGIGWTPFTRDSSASSANLAAEASLAAIQDAGLSVRDIDGVITYFHEHQELAVTQRRHTILNKKAMMRKPIPVEEHRTLWIVYPFHLRDCCFQSDGAVALIVTSTERGRSLRHKPV